MGRKARVIDIGRYRGMDAREMPNYGLQEAALYLGIAPSTLSSWAKGRSYRVKGGWRKSEPLIKLPGDGSKKLSHLNLIEAYVIDAIRRSYKIPLSKVRNALEFAVRSLEIDHPLAHEAFRTDGVDLFLHEVEETINLSMKGKVGQIALPGVFVPYLERISYDTQGLPVRLFLLTRKDGRADGPRTVEIRPFISSGRPVLTGTRITLEMIMQRFEAGDSIRELAGDYGLEENEIEEGIRAWSVLQSRAITARKSRAA